MTARASEAAPAALGEEYGLCVTPGCGTHTKSPSKFALLAHAKKLLPNFQRFQACQEGVVKRALMIAIYTKGTRAHFGGVMRCNSVWICPVCARRIAEQRRGEMREAIDNAIRQGRGVMLITLTFPHGAGDVLQEILDRFAKALRYLKGGKAAAELRKRIGFMGEVRALEVTHGHNGWHPHVHALWITEKPLTEDQMETLRAQLYSRWASSCLKSGLPEPSAAHGVDVRGARYAADYVSKWGFAEEIASAPSKRGKKESGGRTPQQLLMDSYDGDQRAGWLFREFADAFFGKRQLFWSRGLRDALSMAPELTEQELLDLDDERAQQVALLDLDTWYVIRKSRAQEYVLHLAVTDLREMYIYLNQLRSTVTMEHGRPPGPREDWIP